MAVNKSQGQSFNVVGLELSSGCFNHGQLYVARSRGTDGNKLFILTDNGLTPNIVYKDIS